VSLAKSLGPCGLTANSVSPGLVLTPAVERWLESMRGPMGWDGLSMAEMEQQAAAHLTPIPVGRIGRVEDIAHVVCMIASPASGYMTGANIRVDGGQVQSVN
jgi:NAD(P)-dependent dehydrogenase (short-subunit alcohol dehydrogenase family)